jgi:hypothetical protein
MTASLPQRFCRTFRTLLLGLRGPQLRERNVILSDETTHAGLTPAHWRYVALIVARITGKRVGVDTATRMLE